MGAKRYINTAEKTAIIIEGMNLWAKATEKGQTSSHDAEWAAWMVWYRKYGLDCATFAQRRYDDLFNQLSHSRLLEN